MDQPGLLQYSCRLKTNIRPSSAAKISTSGGHKDDDLEVMAGVLGGRPVLALCFEDMEVCRCSSPQSVGPPSLHAQQIFGRLLEASQMFGDMLLHLVLSDYLVHGTGLFLLLLASFSIMGC